MKSKRPQKNDLVCCIRVSRCPGSIRDDFLSCSQSYRSPDLGANWKARKVLNHESATHHRTTNGCGCLWGRRQIERHIHSSTKIFAHSCERMEKGSREFRGTAILRASSHRIRSLKISNSQRQILFRPIGAHVMYQGREGVFELRPVQS